MTEGKEQQQKVLVRVGAGEEGEKLGEFLISSKKHLKGEDTSTTTLRMLRGAQEKKKTRPALICANKKLHKYFF